MLYYFYTVESMSRMFGGYPGPGGIGHRAALKEEDVEENVHDLSDDIDVETDLEPSRLVKYNETCLIWSL